MEYARRAKSMKTIFLDHGFRGFDDGADLIVELLQGRLARDSA